MSHVVSFEIHGLNGRKDVVRHELNRDTNIFFGPNGSGKTSILRILNSALLGDAELIQNVKFDRAKVTLFSIHYDKTYEATYSHQSLSSQKTVREDETTQRRWSINDDPEKGAKDWSFRNVYLPITRLVPRPAWISGNFGWSDSSPKSLSLEDELNERFAAYLQEQWSAQYSEKLKNVRSIQENGLQNVLFEIFNPQASGDVKKNDRI